MLRLDGVLEFDPPPWSPASTAGELLEHDSPEEVEIRACALHAVELLVAAHGATTATDVDNVLWNRGGSRATRRARATGRGRPRTRDDDDVERARAVDALDALELDVARRATGR